MFERVSEGGLGCGAVAVGIAGAAAVVCGVIGFTWAWSTPDTAPAVAYAREIPDAARVVDGIALDALHRELWTRWTVARSPEERAEAAAAITAALASDPPLAGIAGQLLDAAAVGDLATAGDAADVYVAALEARGMPWGVQVGGARSVYVKTYWILARPTIRLGGREAEVRYGLRVDGLNVVEGWLGLAEDIGGAIVVADRVEDFAVDVVWPLLGDEDHPMAPALRAAAEGALGPVIEPLLATADPRRAMVEARAAVDERRRGCGSGFGLRFGWEGLDDLASVRAYADRYRGEACPGITAAEARAVIDGTLAVRSEPGLPEALERLVAWIARHVAVHEARHRIDQEDWGARTPPPCPGCGWLDDHARIEASAYLSALASQDAVVALVQNCDVVASGVGGSAVDAIEAVLGAMDVACDAPPPADLRDRAARVATAWFGRPEEVVLGALPEVIPLAVGD